MNIENEFELLALHKALFELKFRANVPNREIVASPIIAQLSNKVLESLIELYEASGRNSIAQDWKDWKNSLHERPEEKKMIRSHLDRIKDLWINYSAQDKIETVKDLVSPFIVSEIHLQEFLTYLDC